MADRSLEQTPVRASAPEPAARREHPSAAPLSPLLRLQRTHGNRFVGALVAQRSEHEADMATREVSRKIDAGIDGLTTEGEAPGEAIDAAGVLQRVNGDAGVPPVTPTAVPTNWQQIATSWTGGPTKYGFQLKFRCSSSTGDVADLVARPNLVWGEYVTYGVRNDFAHRFTPNDPTILPVPPATFTGATVVSTNVLELTGYADTHWFPTSAVREADFATGSGRTLPAALVSNQIYRYSTDGGSTWSTVAGPYTLTRTLYRTPTSFFGLFGGNLKFKTEKAGIHSVDEDYKP